MRLPNVRIALALVVSLGVSSCSEAPTAPLARGDAPASAALPIEAAMAAPQVVISQIYGGGGNSGATYRNDFIELHNNGTTAVDLAGWSVQYASAAGSSWQVTRLEGVIQPGGYHLVQQAAGSGGTAALPTPDDTGTIPMAATAGKVVLARQLSPVVGACPTGPEVVDRVGFGASTSTGNCVAEWGARTATLSNTTAALRNGGGCTWTGVAANDFSVAAPAPRNSATAVKLCATGPEPASITITPDSARILVGATATFTARVVDLAGNTISAPLTWASTDETIATMSASGVATGRAAGTVRITATAGNGAADTATLTVAPVPPRPVSPATIVVSELMGDPVNAESASWGEWFEVHNHGTAPVDLQGWTILSGGPGQPPHVIDESVIVPAGGYVVLGRGGDVARNGGVSLAYNYFAGSSSTIWLDNADWLALLDADGAIADSVQWATLPRGVTRGLRDAAADNVDVGGANWGFSTTTFGDGDYGTPGAANAGLADTPPFVSPNRISISGRTAGDAPLPVGFEAQLFASLFDATNTRLDATFTWTSLTPAIASVDARGVIRALAAGTATFRVVANDGTARNHTLVMETPVASTTAQYLNHLEFGAPADADARDDFLVSRREFVSSWNDARGIPNWVAYNLNGTHIASGQDRCNCFTFDPQLEGAGFARYTTADYTGAGAAAGYGIDRGHLVRSFDRTTGTLDNATTYYFSNIIPQASDNNQGPWSVLEIALGDSARFGDREVYVHAGAAGSRGTVKNEGRITIPEWTWKVAVLLPRGATLADVRDYRDLNVIAVVMPNVAGIRNVDWRSYRVTVDSIEALTGYDLLSALDDRTERAVESDTKPPLAAVDGPYATREGTAVAMSAAASVDPNGTIVSYAWDFGDGTTGTGATTSHTYGNAGTYTVRLVATDDDGLVDTVSTTVTVARILPEQGLANLSQGVQALVRDGRLNGGNGNSLHAKIRAASGSLQQGNLGALVNQVEAFINEVDAMERSGRLEATGAAALRFEAQRLIRAVTA